VCGGAHFECDVTVGRPVLPGFIVQLLQLCVAHRGQRIFGQAIGVEIRFGDSHAPDGQALPALGGGVEPWPGHHVHIPKLFLATPVILPVIGDPEIRSPERFQSVNSIESAQ
jgi:hypothetical protein